MLSICERALADRRAGYIGPLKGLAAIVVGKAGDIIGRGRSVEDVERRAGMGGVDGIEFPAADDGINPRIQLEPNLRPLPKGSWYTTLVTLLSFTSKLVGPYSAFRL